MSLATETTCEIRETGLLGSGDRPELSHSGLAFFYESAPVLMGVVEVLPDGDLLHLYDNPAAARFFGASPSGARASEVGVPTATITLWRSRYEQSAAVGAPVEFDYLHRQDGVGERMLAVKVAPMRREDAARSAVFCYVAEDVTDRRRAEAALADSEARLRATFDQAAVGIAQVALDGRWLRVNSRLCEMLGFTEAELRSRTFQELTHPADLELDLAYTRRMVSGEIDRFSMEKRYVRADGTTIWGQLTVSMLKDASGVPEHFISVVEDITARKDAEARLQDAERAFRQRLEAEIAQRTAERDRIWNSGRDLMCVARSDGVFLSANPAWEKVLGWKPEEVVGRNAVDFQPAEDIERLAGELGALEEDVPAPPCEHRYRHKDGSWRWISWCAQLHAGVIYSIGRDVTQERAQRVALEQAEAALRQAAKMEAIGRLTGGIAHDFNNLLAAIVGSFELIQKRADDPEKIRRFAEGGLETAERGARLTSQLLAFSRTQELQSEPTPLGRLVVGMREMLERTLGPALRLTIENDAADTCVNCDPVQMEMAVLNLVINARDAMPQGGELKVECAEMNVREHPELPAGRYLQLTVRDGGVGMAEDVLTRAFEPFFTTKPAGKGAGIGLSQVYAVVRQSRGAIGVESRLGAGTTVTILLPVEHRAGQGDAPVRSTARFTRTGARVLVVDDDPDVRRVAVRLLEELGCAVSEAAGGVQALAQLETSRPELLLVDFVMPVMNGAQLAQQVTSRHPDIPIVFATGYAETEAIHRAVGKHAKILRKPFRMDELERTLVELLT